MRTLRPQVPRSKRRGAALLLTFLVLIVILMIVYQVARITTTERNEADRVLTETQMDLAIASAFLENQTILKDDADQAAGGEPYPSADPGATGAADPEASADPNATSEDSAPNDSLMDGWATVQQSTIGDVDVVTFITDEDSKFNILGMLSEDTEEADKAEAITTRILDRCREGTTLDIDGGTASEMARTMRTFMVDRSTGGYPTPNRVDTQAQGAVLPLTMQEFLVLRPFEEQHFRDFFDERGNRVYSIDHFLTIYSSPVLGPNATSTLGYKVNANTAPLAVLAGLFEAREVDPRVWLEIIEYRNTEEETDPNADESEAQFRQNRFNEELPQFQTFHSLDQIEELPTLSAMEPELRNEVLARLKIDSQVFSITILAKKSTLSNPDAQAMEMRREDVEREEQAGTDLVRVVRQVLWRESGDEGTTMRILLNWSALDYVPLEMLDTPD
ncbi:MAG: hypothetical protein H6830_11590 [Planctomycetes bacterium]|nr:hypothetical protein [Planctomycetota bacterium]MCB9908689.1 hypothetical protein [Planctomycetota bacterium]MCB9913158.1 hypothetical protein [Planctomycetota bacterium]HPF13808.1 hypothetical protein [Planctomycetota bacterium]HRV80634.1 hypothetical protein [Planctomycetota bacterium]